MLGNFEVLNRTLNIYIYKFSCTTRVCTQWQSWQSLRLKWSIHGGEPFLPLVGRIVNVILHFKRLFFTKSCHARLADGCSGCKMILSGVDGHICQPTPCITHTQAHTQLTPSQESLRYALQPPPPAAHSPPTVLLLLTTSQHINIKSPLRPGRSDWSSHHSPFLFSLFSH